VRAFRSAFSSVREEDILSFFEKKIFSKQKRIQTKSSYDESTQKRLEIISASSDAKRRNAVGGGGAFRGGHQGAWQKKRTWRYGGTP
jgi:hypothetical protein